MRLCLPTTDTDVESLIELRRHAGAFFVQVLWMSIAVNGAIACYFGLNTPLVLAGSLLTAIAGAVAYLKNPVGLGARLIIAVCLTNNYFFLIYSTSYTPYQSDAHMSLLLLEAVTIIFFCWKTLWAICLYALAQHAIFNLFMPSYLYPSGTDWLRFGWDGIMVFTQCLGATYIAVRVHRMFAESKRMFCELQKTSDLAERRKVLAEQACDAKGQFLANMSHELRTPMHAILNYTSMSEEVLGTGETKIVKRYIKTIHSSAERLLDLLNDLLDLSKLQAGKMAFKKEPGDVVDALEQAVIETRSILLKKNLCIAKIIKTENTLALLDKQRIVQVLINLIANSARFSEPNASIEIVVQRFALDEETSLHVQVLDRGPGIPEAELTTIFDKFTQSSTTKSGAGGTGLGLAICYEIVLAHGGMMWAENRDGGGAVLNFLIHSKMSELTGLKHLQAA